MKKIYKTLILIMLVVSSLFSYPKDIYAAEKSLNASMIIQFSTEIQYGENLTDFKIALSYLVYPSSNPGNNLRDTILVENGKSISGQSKTLAVVVPSADGIEYKGSFSFSYTYDSSNGRLTVNGSEVDLGSSRYIEANAYPEAWVAPAVVGVGMNAQPFSLVKAFAGMSASQIAAFDARANGEITDNLVLASSIYGTNIQTNTKLSMYVNVWKRLPNGTYDKTQSATRVQVIYSAADLMNGVASSASWTGVQYFRQLVGATVSSHSSKTEPEYVWNGKYRDEYQVRDYVRTDYAWGFNGSVGGVSGITSGTCYGSSSKNCVNNFYKYSRYEIKCSNYWRTSTATYWNNSPNVGDSFCKAKNSSKPYFREVSNTQTTTWTTLTSWPNYVRTETGHTYQVKVGTMVWGTAYWQLFAPNSDQKLVSTRKVQLFETIYNNYIIINLNSVPIQPVDKITESDVNGRVNTYAAGYLDTLVSDKSGSTKFTSSTYTTLSSNYRAQASGMSVSYFKEGNYWGLYLYLTGHWRAVEVPVGWYSLSANTNSGTTLIGEYDDSIPDPIIPDDPEKDTEIALTDFTYIESVYGQIKNQNIGATLNTIQTKFIERLRDDNNNAAKVVIKYYDSLINQGKSRSEALTIISADYNIDIKD